MTTGSLTSSTVMTVSPVDNASSEAAQFHLRERIFDLCAKGLMSDELLQRSAQRATPAQVMDLFNCLPC